LATVAEPYKIPDDNPNWVGNESGSAAIVRVAADISPSLRLVRRGEGFVAAEWGPYYIVSCYAPPRWRSGRFDTFLDQLGAVVDDIFRGTPNALMIVAGDFNARSPAWGDTRRNPRGHPLENWMSRHGLVLLNTGRASTCVRPQGRSIVPLRGTPCRGGGARVILRSAETVPRVQPSGGPAGRITR